MELNEALIGRRSIRQFDKERQVTRENIEEIIKAGQLAPSWKNSQTARFLVISGKENIDEFRENCLYSFNQRNTEFAKFLIVCMFEKNVSGFSNNLPDNEIANGWGCYDLGLATQNILLKAYELGLGSLVMGIRNSDKIRELYGIPESQEIMSVIALGYPGTNPTMPPRKNLSDIATFFD